MAYRLITSVRRADRILKSGLFTGNFNNLVKPKRLELRQFLSQLPHPPKGFGKPLGPKASDKSAAFTAGGIGGDPKSSSLSGGRDGPEGNEEKSSGGPGSGGMNKRQIGFTIGSAAILGVSLQDVNDDDNEKQSVPADLAELVTAANSTDPQIQYDAVTTVRKLVSYEHPSPMLDPLISCNILPALVNCLSSKNPALQFEAAWALTLIASGASHQTEAVVQAGAIPRILELLASPYERTRVLAVGALWIVISNGPHLRDYVINLGAVAPMLKCIQPDFPITLLRSIARVILNLCHFKDTPPPPETLREILRVLSVLVHHKDTGVLVDTVWALSSLTDGGKEQIQMVLDSGALPKLVQLLSHPEVNVKMVAVRAVGNIIFKGTGDQVQAVLNSNALSYFHHLLNHPTEKICNAAMVILSRVTAGNGAHVQAVIHAGLIPLIIHHLEKGEFQTKKVAACSVSSMAINGNKEQVAHLVDCGVILPFCNLLNSKDSQAIQVVLSGIRNILNKAVNQDGADKIRTLIEECGGLDKIESLKNHENKEICKISCNIIQNYFSDDVEKDSDLAPEAAENAHQSNPIKLP